MWIAQQQWLLNVYKVQVELKLSGSEWWLWAECWGLCSSVQLSKLWPHPVLPSQGVLCPCLFLSFCIPPCPTLVSLWALWHLLYPGEAKVASILWPLPKGKMSRRNLLENCSNHSPPCSSFSASIVRESPDSPHHKQNGVLEKNAPDPLGPSFETTSPNSCFLQLDLMFHFCLSIGLSLSYQVAITNHCWADWNQICNDDAGRARPLPRR